MFKNICKTKQKGAEIMNKKEEKTIFERMYEASQVSNDKELAELIEKENQKTQKQKISSNPYRENGTLKVLAKKTATLWFIEVETQKKIGPFLITQGKAENIELKKGLYLAEIIEGGNKRTTSISFISDTGKLEL